MHLLSQWSLSDALMSDDVSMTGHAIRKWVLATATILFAVDSSAQC